MPGKRIVILDGTGSADTGLLPILDQLSHLLQAEDAHIVTYPLRDTKMAHCVGCFGCWLKTPGMCVEIDAGRDIAKAIVRSDLTVLFTPVTFGGYSPELKKMVDRFVPIASPLFHFEHGEVHHPPRYAKRPRLLYVGVQRKPDPAEAHIFTTLAGRNAINFHPPSYAAEVVPATEDVTALQRRFEALLVRSDTLPFGDAVASLMPAPVSPNAVIPGTTANPAPVKRALLIIGSPKIGEPSTSSALGSFLLDSLLQQGWETESLTLRASLHRPQGQAELLTAVERASLILFAFPLYVDSLPYLVTKAMALIAAHPMSPMTSPMTTPVAIQRVVALVNSGFPETYQNSVAVAICRHFAVQTGRRWDGALAFGAGGMIGGQPLAQPKRQGPPVKHLMTALEITAAALAQGQPVPVEAINMIAKNPIPSALFRRLYIWIGGIGFKRAAKKNGIGKAALLARPYSR